MTAWMPSIISAPEAPRQKSWLLRVFIWAFLGVVLLILIVVPLYANVGARATLAKAQFDVQHLASAVDQYQAHMGAPPATLAELTYPATATNARGQTAGPFLSAVPSPSFGFSAYRYERHADGHWTITTSGRDSCDRPHRIEATSGSSVTPTQFRDCPRTLFSGVVVAVAFLGAASYRMTGWRRVGAQRPPASRSRAGDAMRPPSGWVNTNPLSNPAPPAEVGESSPAPV